MTIQMKMIHITRTLAAVGLAGAALLGCKPEFDAPSPSRGAVDFSRYVAVGNSLTAGYTNDGLYNEGQAVSYPNLIAQQLQSVGGGNFAQPTFSEAQQNGSGYLTFTGFGPLGLPQLSRVTTQLAVTGLGLDNRTPLLAPYEGQAPLNNLGVPGIRVSDVTTIGYGLNNPNGFNPFFQRLLPATLPGAAQSYLQFASASNPTFFTCWLGNNDVLGYALSGGVVPVTPSSLFTANYGRLVDSLAIRGAAGALANLGDITTIPFLNTISLATISRATAGTPLANATLLIRTSSGVRAATAEDLITLTADSIGVPNAAGLPKGFHPNHPLNNEDVLDRDEVLVATATVEAYNRIIREAADRRNLALVDFNAILKALRAGQVYNGVAVNTAFISGGIFSLDGVHLTPRGNAIAANEFIKAINAKYGSSIPQVDVNNYPGVRFT